MKSRARLCWRRLQSQAQTAFQQVPQRRALAQSVLFRLRQQIIRNFDGGLRTVGCISRWKDFADGCERLKA